MSPARSGSVGHREARRHFVVRLSSVHNFAGRVIKVDASKAMSTSRQPSPYIFLRSTNSPISAKLAPRTSFSKPRSCSVRARCGRRAAGEFQQHHRIDRNLVLPHQPDQHSVDSLEVIDPDRRVDQHHQCGIGAARPASRAWSRLARQAVLPIGRARMSWTLPERSPTCLGRDRQAPTLFHTGHRSSLRSYAKRLLESESMKFRINLCISHDWTEFCRC